MNDAKAGSPGPAKAPAPAKPVRVAILSSAGAGGGGIAARRMADALSDLPGVTADFLTGDELGGFLPPAVAPMRNLSNRRSTDTHFTLEYPGFRRDWVVDFLARFDAVNVHWASYLISLAELDALAARGKPLLFMLHDFYYITGGCHYPAGCNRMTSGCLACPQIDSAQGSPAFIPANLRIKQDIFRRPNVQLLAPSRFLRDRAIQTGIVPEDRAHVLRNPYRPEEVHKTRPNDGTVRILLIADTLAERRKGMALALDSLNALALRVKAMSPARKVMVHVIGAPDEALTQALACLQLPHHLHGRITEHPKLVEVVATCDLLLTCSFEDNWPNVLVESGAYGCVPVVGPGHGCEEFVRHYKIGKVAAEYTADAFADALAAAITTMPAPAGRKDFAARIRGDHQPPAMARHLLRIAGLAAR